MLSKETHASCDTRRRLMLLPFLALIAFLCYVTYESSHRVAAPFFQSHHNRVVSPNAASGDPSGECKLFQNAGGDKVSDGAFLFATRVTEKMQVSFKVKVNAVSDVYANIIHVGANKYERSPAVFLYKDRIKKIRFAFNGDRYVLDDPSTVNVDIEIGVEYQVRILIDDLVVQVFFDDVLKETRTLLSKNRLLRDDVPVYAAKPYDTHAVADAVVKELIICADYGSFPTSLCQEHHTNAKVARGTKLFDVDYIRHMDVQLRVTVDEDSPSVHIENVLHVGSPSVSANMFPDVFFFHDELQVYFGRQHYRTFERVFHVPIIRGPEYLLRVKIQDTQVWVYLDGQLVLDSPQIHAETKPDSGETMAVYASSPWHSAVRGSVPFVRVCNGEDPYPLTMDEKCLSWPNSAGAKLVKTNLVMHTPSERRMGLEFKLTVNALSSGWKNILHVGSTNQERGPAVFLSNNNKKLLHFAFHGGQQNGYVTQNAVNIGFDLGVEYEVRIVMDTLNVKIYFDDVLKKELNLQGENRFYGEEVPVYVSDPWHPAADAVLKDLNLCYWTTNPLGPLS